jgi:hypothetical protein
MHILLQAIKENGQEANANNEQQVHVNIMKDKIKKKIAVITMHSIMNDFIKFQAFKNTMFFKVSNKSELCLSEVLYNVYDIYTFV